MKKIIIIICLLFVFTLRVDAAITITQENYCGTCVNNKGQEDNDSKRGIELDTGDTCGGSQTGNVESCTVESNPCEKPTSPCDEEDGSSEEYTYDCDYEKYNAVILIDATGSMESKKDSANTAVNNLIEVLKAKEADINVLVMAFKGRDVEITNWKNISKMSTNGNYVTSTKGRTNIQFALVKAYSYLKEKNSSDKRVPVLFFITDGYPTEIYKDTKLGLDINGAAYTMKYSSPARFFYYTMETMAKFKEGLGDDTLMFTFGVMESNDVLGKYFLNPSKNNYEKLSTINVGSDLKKLLSTSERNKKKFSDTLIGPRDTFNRHAPIVNYKNGIATFYVYKHKLNNSPTRLNLCVTGDIKKSFEFRINGGSWVNGNNKKITRTETLDPNDYCYEYNINSSINKDKSIFNFTDNSNNKTYAKVEVRLTNKNINFQFYDSSNFNTWEKYIDKNDDNKSFITSSYISSWGDLKKYFGDAVEEIASCKKKKKKDSCEDPDEEEKVCTPKIEKYYKPAYCVTNTYFLTNSDDNKSYYYKMKGLFSDCKDGKCETPGGTPIKKDTCVKVKSANIRYIVTKSASFKFGSIVKDKKLYSGGGYGFVGTQYSETINWDYSKIGMLKSDQTLQPVLYKVFIEYKKNNVVNSKRIGLNSILISDLYTDSKCNNNLTKEEVTEDIKESINSSGITTREKKTSATVFKAIDSNKYANGTVSFDADHSSNRLGKNNPGILSASTGRLDGNIGGNSGLTLSSIFTLQRACINKKTAIVNYISGNLKCNEDLEIDGNIFRYIPLDFDFTKDKVVSISTADKVNMAFYSKIPVTVKGSCSTSDYRKSRINYRSISLSKPFPKGKTTDTGGYKNTNWSNKDDRYRLKLLYDSFDEEKFDYKYVGKFAGFKNVTVVYTDFGTIDKSGTSSFLTSLKNGTYGRGNTFMTRVNNKNYCPLGTFNNKKCDSRLGV